MCNYYTVDRFAYCECEVPSVAQLQGISSVILKCCHTAAKLELGGLIGFNGSIDIVGSCCYEASSSLNIRTGIVCGSNDSVRMYTRMNLIGFQLNSLLDLSKQFKI